MPEHADEIPRGRLLRYAVPVGAFAVVSTIGAAFMPWFLANMPLVLIAMSPLFRHLVLVAPQVDTVPFFAIGLVRHLAPDPFMYFLGRDYGPAGIEWVENNSPMAGKMVRTLERIFARGGVITLLIWPDLLFSTFAGAARVPFPLFLLFNVLGTIGTLVVAKFAGHALEHQIAALMQFFRGNLLLVTGISVAVILALNWFSQRKKATRDNA